MSPVPKLGARHVWAGGVTLGDPTVWPKYRLKKISGLGSLGERDDMRDPAYGRTGEIPRRSERRGKTVTYEGVILARHIGEMRQAESNLLAAFAPTVPLRMDILTPLDAGQPDLWFMGESMACDVDDEHILQDSGMEWQRPFTIAVRMADPRVFEDAEQTATQAAGARGLTLPVTLPATITAADGQTSIEVGGNAPVDPIVDVQGPFGGLILSNVTLDRQLVIPVPVAAGSWARVDFAARAVLVEGETDVTGEVDFAASTWWDLDQWGMDPAAGPNVLQALDTAGGAAPAFTVTWNNAMWG